MSEPMLGEIKMFAFHWPPVDYAQCNGQEIEITQNPALYALMGTEYGGDGTTSFGLPELRGRLPLGSGGIYTRGQKWGLENVTLNLTTMGTHTHQMKAQNSDAHMPLPFGNDILSNSVNTDVYEAPANLVELNTGTCAGAGSSQSHNNMMPFATINFCIALKGEFPQRN